MLRIFQAVVVLMGGLLLITVLGLHQRNKVGALQQILVSEYWSPNGLDDYYRLWLVQPDTGRRIELANAWEILTIIGWDSNGALIFEEGGYDQVPMLTRVKRNGTGRKELSEWTLSDYQDAVKIAPDGRTVVILETKTSGIVSIRTDGTNRRVIAPGLTDPRVIRWAVSPDSQWVAFSADNLQQDMVWARLDGSEIGFVTHDFNGPNAMPKPIDWVSIAEGLVVECLPKLCWFDIMTGTMRRITTSEENLYEVYEGINEEAGLVYIFTQLQGGSNRTLHAFRYDTGASIWSLNATSYISFSPNHLWLLHETTSNQWAIMDAVTGENLKLDFPFTVDGTQDHLWSPNGQRMVMTGLNMTTQQTEIWRVDPSKAEIQRIWEGPDFIYNLVWSADGNQLFFYTGSAGNKSSIRLTWDGEILPMPAFVQSTDLHFEAMPLTITKRKMAESQLLLTGAGLLALGIVLTLVRSHPRIAKP